MKTCYVSMPLGVKDGIDFDALYREVIMPAVLDAGIACQRGDEFAGAALIQRAILQAVMASDVVIADVSNRNPNVMYELGIRHALRRGVTILLSSGYGTLPFHVQTLPVFRYGGEGEVVTGEAAAASRARLTDLIRDRLARVTNDSPMFEYFRGLHVELPSDLPPGELRYTYPATGTKPRGKVDRKPDVARAEEVTRGTVNVDPHAYIDVLTRYRDLEAWGDVVRYAATLPSEVRNSPQVVPTVAVAHHRLGDYAKAIDLLRRYTAETGGDAESDSLLGSLFKKEYFEHHHRDDLREAITCYRRGFQRDPQNLYLGRALALSLVWDGPTSSQELSALLPRVRDLAARKLEASPVPDYWDVECALILSAIARDWTDADRLLETMQSLRPESWMLDGARTELDNIAAARPDDDGAMRKLIERVGHLVAEEQDYA